MGHEQHRLLHLYLKGQESDGYEVRLWRTGCSMGVLDVNWSDPDPVLRELIRDRRFR
ncbi:hypothetical protein HS125_09225 [bacterium]|nr:hypothetical protein [bacterium]